MAYVAAVRGDDNVVTRKEAEHDVAKLTDLRYERLDTKRRQGQRARWADRLARPQTGRALPLL